MGFKVGDIVKFDIDYIYSLKEDNFNIHFGDIERAIEHIEKGNNPIEIINIRYEEEVELTTCFVLNGIRGYKNDGFMVTEREIKPISNKIKKLEG